MAAALLPAARAQTPPAVPVAPVPVVLPAPASAPPAPADATPHAPVPPGAQARPDSLRAGPAAAPTFAPDTTRAGRAVEAAEPTTEVTRRTGLRIGAAILVLTLTTLLLYNVRSR